MKLNKDIAEEHLKVLREANQQWFYGYDYEVVDSLKLVQAMRFFEHIEETLWQKLIKEGKV